MKYLKYMFLLCCIGQITILYAPSEQEGQIAYAMDPSLYRTNIMQAIQNVENQANSIAQQQHISYQEALDELSNPNRGVAPMSPMPSKSPSRMSSKEQNKKQLLNKISKNLQSLQNDVTKLQQIITSE